MRNLRQIDDGGAPRADGTRRDPRLRAGAMWARRGGRTILSTGVALLFSISCAHGRGAHSASTDVLASGKLEHGGRMRTYRYHLPKRDPGGLLPLVLAIHGRLGDGAKMEQLAGFAPVSDREGFLVVYPECIDKSWNDDRGGTPASAQNVDDVGFIDALIEKFVRDHRADPARVYAIGISNGGFFAQRLACRLANRLAAVVSVVATVPRVLPERCTPGRPVPIAFFLGTDDGFVPYKGGTVRGDAGGATMSAEDSARFWARLNGCDDKPERTDDAGRGAADGTRVSKQLFRGCKGQGDVVLFTIEGGGHTWPGGWQYLPKMVVGRTTGRLSATEQAWDFFRGHRRMQ